MIKEILTITLLTVAGLSLASAYTPEQQTALEGMPELPAWRGLPASKPGSEYRGL